MTSKQIRLLAGVLLGLALLLALLAWQVGRQPAQVPAALRQAEGGGDAPQWLGGWALAGDTAAGTPLDTIPMDAVAIAASVATTRRTIAPRRPGSTLASRNGSGTQSSANRPHDRPIRRARTARPGFVAS